MGIRGLNKIIKKHASDAIKEKSIQFYRGKKFGIDSSILLYKYRYASQGMDDNSHLFGFLQKTFYYLSRGILPIYIFDGPPPVQKRVTLDKRVKQRAKVETKIKILETLKANFSTYTISDEHLDEHPKEYPDPSEQINVTITQSIEIEFETEQAIQDEIDKLSKQVTYVNRSHRQDCKYLLRLMGIPTIEAKGEAEATCAVLQKRGIVDYTCTEDTDALTFGAPFVLKSTKKNDKVIESDLGEILKGLELTQEQFIDFCILCGCDYTPKIGKIGPITGLAMIRKHKTIEKILETLPEKYTVPDNFDYISARELFLEESHWVPENIPPLELMEPQWENLEKFIIEEKEISPHEYSKLSRKYKNSLTNFNRQTQTKPPPDLTQKKIFEFLTPIPNPKNHQQMTPSPLMVTTE